MLKTALFQHKYIPARTPGASEKVLVVLHGLGDSLNGFTWMPQELRLDSLSYLLLNAPDDYYGGFSWFDFTAGGTDMGPAIAGIHRSRKLIRQLVDELMAQGVKSQDILLFGFSQGCLMALDAGLRADVVLGGVCGVSGWLAFAEEYPAAFSAVAAQQEFLVTHGLRDPLLPFRRSQAQMTQLKALGIRVEFREYDKDHTILPEELKDIRNWLATRLSG
jgi:phospholipase/carboxylesterase